MLTASPDYETTLASLARLLAGHAGRLVRDRPGRGRWRDPSTGRRPLRSDARAGWRASSRRSPLRAPSFPRRWRASLTGGHAELIAEADEAAIARMAVRRGAGRAWSTALGMRSAMIVPLVRRGHVLGALTLVRAEGGPYTPADLGMTQELAGRVGHRGGSGAQVPERAAGPHAASSGSSTASTASCGRPTRPRSSITFVSHRAERLARLSRAALAGRAGVLAHPHSSRRPRGRALRAARPRAERP